jgi:phosphoserine phosphatase
MSALHVFDMDGTLLRGTTASLEIARRLDHVEALEDLERRFASGTTSAPEFAVEVRELWVDLDPDLVADVVSAAPWIEGIDEVCADIAGRGESSMLITMSPDFFADHLTRHGIDVIHASAFPPLPFEAPVDPSAILGPTDKVRLTEAERAARDLPLGACVAYGDSTSDEPLFAHLERTVAVNASPALESVARVAYRGHDLREAYALGRSLLDGAGSSRRERGDPSLE